MHGVDRCSRNCDCCTPLSLPQVLLVKVSCSSAQVPFEKRCSTRRNKVPISFRDVWCLDEMRRNYISRVWDLTSTVPVSHFLLVQKAIKCMGLPRDFSRGTYPAVLYWTREKCEIPYPVSRGPVKKLRNPVPAQTSPPVKNAK